MKKRQRLSNRLVRDEMAMAMATPRDKDPRQLAINRAAREKHVARMRLYNRLHPRGKNDGR